MRSRSLLIAAMLILQIFAWGPVASAQEAAADGEVLSTAPVTLRMTLVFDRQYMAKMEQLIADFHRTQDSVRITPICLPGFYEDDIVNRHRAGEAYDLIWAPELLVDSFVRNGVLRPLEGTSALQEDGNNSLPWLEGLFQRDDKRYAVPFSWTPFFVLCNRSVFELYNTALPRADWTWNDLRRAAGSFPRKQGESTAAGAFAMNSDWWSGWYPFLWSAGGQLETSPVFTSGTATVKAIADVFEFLQQLDTDGMLRRSDGRKAFGAGEVAMMVASASDYLDLRGVTSCTILPVPRRDKRRPQITGYGGVGFGIHAHSRHRTESELFLAYIRSDRASDLVTSLALGFPCSVNAMSADREWVRAVHAEGGEFLFQPPTARAPRFFDFQYATELLKMQTRLLLDRGRAPAAAAEALIYQIVDEMDH